MTQLHSFSQFISRYLPGKIQKITVNAGFMCPNRDGSKGVGGCIYCNNSTFSPQYTMGRHTVAEQIEHGKAFFARKYPSMRYVAYFQSYTSTNADVSRLMEMYDEALSADGVDGIIIGTRPDCMPDELLENLSQLARRTFVMVEYGAESANDRTLNLINRCHTWSDTADSVRRTADVGIPVGLHMILGLPGEGREEIFNSIREINMLPVDTVKFHQLQVVRGAQLAEMVERQEIDLWQFTVDEYIELCAEIMHRLRNDIVVERFVSQSPDSLLISPRWGLKNYEFMDRLRKALK